MLTPAAGVTCYRMLKNYKGLTKKAKKAKGKKTRSKK